MPGLGKPDGFPILLGDFNPDVFWLILSNEICSHLEKKSAFYFTPLITSDYKYLLLTLVVVLSSSDIN